MVELLVVYVKFSVWYDILLYFLIGEYISVFIGFKCRKFIYYYKYIYFNYV